MRLQDLPILHRLCSVVLLGSYVRSPMMLWAGCYLLLSFLTKRISQLSKFQSRSMVSRIFTSVLLPF